MISRIEIGGARAAAEMRGQVLVVRFEGLLVVDALTGMKRGIMAQMAVEPDAVLADYSGAVLAMTDGQLDEMMAGDDPENLFHLPAAVVAPRAGSQAVQAAALRAAVRHGALRSVVPSLQAGQHLVRRLMDLAAATKPGTRQP